MLPPSETQKLWDGTCAQDKCYRAHDGTGWKRTDTNHASSAHPALNTLLTVPNGAGKACGARTTTSGVPSAGSPRKVGPERTSEAHTANSAYAALPDDSVPKPQGTGDMGTKTPMPMEAIASRGASARSFRLKPLSTILTLGRTWPSPIHGPSDDTILSRAPVGISIPTSSFELSPPYPTPGNDVMV